MIGQDNFLLALPHALEKKQQKGFQVKMYGIAVHRS